MNTIIFIIIPVIIVGLIIVLKNLTLGKEKLDFPYEKKEYLMTKAEHEFFKVLQQVVGDRYYIIPQVQLSNLVQVEKSKRWEYSYRNKIDHKSVDFVLFNKEYFTPHLVIELDDSSHLRKAREIRDHFLNEVLNKVRIKVIHVKTGYGYGYDLNQISNLLI